MKNRGIAAFAGMLLFFSSVVSAGVPNGAYSKDYDLGTLTSTHYINTPTVRYPVLQHSYTFDLATPSMVYGWLYNPVPEKGSILDGTGIISTLYSLTIYDKFENLLYIGETTAMTGLGTTGALYVNGALPAGNDYWALVSGQVIGDSSLTYMVDLVAGPVPIPEPETYAMLLAGLGLLGWRLRRT